jgi:hypothetical protein
MPSHHPLVFSITSLLGALALGLLPACSSASDQTQLDEPARELQASAATEVELGVRSWAVFDVGEQPSLRIVGLDESSGRQVELQVERPAEDSAELGLQLVFPEPGSARIARDGSVQEGSSQYAEQLARALYADLGTSSNALATGEREEVEDSELGTANFAFTVADEGHIPMPWSLFGYAADEIKGSWCQQGTRDHSDAYSSSGASCWVKRWATDSAFDCRILVHYGISGGRSDTCNWYVYRNP